MNRLGYSRFDVASRKRAISHDSLFRTCAYFPVGRRAPPGRALLARLRGAWHSSSLPALFKCREGANPMAEDRGPVNLTDTARGAIFKAEPTARALRDRERELSASAPAAEQPSNRTRGPASAAPALPDPLYTLGALSEVSGIGEARLRAACSSGALASSDASGVVRVFFADFSAWHYASARGPVSPPTEALPSENAQEWDRARRRKLAGANKR